MKFQNLIPDSSISLFVKNILFFEEEQDNQKTILPFFADGYPGLVFQKSKNGLTVHPHDKKMPVLFLYGQTIQPIELIFQGNYQLLVFQLFPFIMKSFFSITPHSLNDNCIDLLKVEGVETNSSITQLGPNTSLESAIEVITAFLNLRFIQKRSMLDEKVRQSLELIIANKGQLGVKEICSKLRVNERTLGRRFLNEVGILPKQFATIIQFQSSLEQLTVKDFNKLTDIVYENGFADQSHFIKVFKSFTGKTPKAFAW